MTPEQIEHDRLAKMRSTLLVNALIHLDNYTRAQLAKDILERIPEEERIRVIKELQTMNNA